MSVLNVVVALKLHVNIIIVHIHQESLFQPSGSKVDFLSSRSQTASVISVSLLLSRYYFEIPK